ncbi:hypothetical protein M0R45_011484 [Rubus argutus]|uniref:Receptor-like serine/threonine-protein kinase n=2 Tax=Rubus argutus TaxID=59490 RepID=A0AAW1YAA1_RUBAR
MGGWNLIHFTGFILLSLLLLSETCLASVRRFGSINPGFEGAQWDWIDNNGLFLLCNQSVFGFGFVTTPQDVTLFLLVIIHMDSGKIVWTANRGSPVSNSDKFVFDDKGGVSLLKSGSVVWTIDTGGKTVSAMELHDSGNLALLGDDNGVVWQSFSHPTDTLLWNHDFQQGMKLESEPGSNNVSYILEIKSGDLILSAGFKTPQPYWSIGRESRKTIYKDGGEVTSASISENSWKFYDSSKVLLWLFFFSSNVDVNATWIAVLGNDGVISFSNLQNGDSNGLSATKIPGDSCSTPEACDAYFECSSDNKCLCPSGLSSYANCKSGIVTSCDPSKGSTELTSAGDGLYYSPLAFVSPSSRTNLEGCKSSCLGNCSCVALFYQSSTRNCYMFDRIGSFQNSDKDFSSYVKVLSDGGSGSGSGGSRSKKWFPYIVIVAISTVLLICGLLYVGYRYYRRKRNSPESPDSFWENLSGMPIRFSYKDLQTATNIFSNKLGQGEVIGGRKNYDQTESSEKSRFPSYAFKMLREGKMKDIVDSEISIDDADERVSTAIVVALWCIQEDMSMRPSMAKVVQVLEGLCPAPQPPTSATMICAGPSECKSDDYISAELLSGPR